MEKKKKSVGKIILEVFEWVLIIAFALFAILCLVFTRSTPTSKSSGNLFGYETRLVVSGSMEGTDEFYKDKNYSVGRIQTGSLIFLESLPSDSKSDSYKTFVNNIKVGDVLTFTPVNISQEMSITHRVISIEEKGNIKYFTTKGDAPSITATETFPQNNIIGKVTKTSYFLGCFYTNFLNNKPLVATIILVPTVAIIGYETYKIVKIVKEDKALKKASSSDKEHDEKEVK